MENSLFNLINEKKQNFRQKGTEYKGSLFKGVIANAYCKNTLGSIPVKLETVIDSTYLRPLKKYPPKLIIKDFRKEIPGPGSYHFTENKNGGSLFNLKSSSFSKKGFGNGFLSVKERFEKSLNSKNPGPGNYNIENKDKNDKNKFQFTSCFMPLRGKIKTEKSIPGPGDYEIKFETKQSCPIFKSERFNSKTSDVPSPTNYEIIYNKKSDFSKLSSKFIIPSLKHFKINLYDPFSTVFEENHNQIGPGYYKDDNFSIIKELEDKKKIHKEFTKFPDSKNSDRFESVKFLKNALNIPGPGKYNLSINHVFHSPKTLIESDHLNDAKQQQNIINSFNRTPGPAYYKLNHLQTESKNVNPFNQWI